METVTTILPIIIDILLIVLLIVGIILLIKCICIIDKAKALILNVEEKVNSLNSFFSLFSMISGKVSLATEKIVSYVEGFIIKLFDKKEKNEKLEEEEILEKILDKERN